MRLSLYLDPSPGLLHFPLSPSPSLFPSPQPKSLSCVTSSLAPFSTFHTATSVPVPFVFCSKPSGGSSVSLRQGTQGWLAPTDLFQPGHRYSFAQTLLVARLVVPERTGFSGLPLCLCTCHSLTHSSSLDFNPRVAYLRSEIFYIGSGKIKCFLSLLLLQ